MAESPAVFSFTTPMQGEVTRYDRYGNKQSIFKDPVENEEDTKVDVSSLHAARKLARILVKKKGTLKAETPEQARQTAQRLLQEYLEAAGGGSDAVADSPELSRTQTFSSDSSPTTPVRTPVYSPLSPNAFAYTSEQCNTPPCKDINGEGQFCVTVPPAAQLKGFDGLNQTAKSASSDEVEGDFSMEALMKGVPQTRPLPRRKNRNVTPLEEDELETCRAERSAAALLDTYLTRRGAPPIPPPAGSAPVSAGGSPTVGSSPITVGGGGGGGGGATQLTPATPVLIAQGGPTPTPSPTTTPPTATTSPLQAASRSPPAVPNAAPVAPVTSPIVAPIAAKKRRKVKKQNTRLEDILVSHLSIAMADSIYIGGDDEESDSEEEPDLQSFAVRLHNKQRLQVGSTEVTHNVILAANAQLHAEKCAVNGKLSYALTPTEGQNVFQLNGNFTGKASDEEIVEQAVACWAAEEERYHAAGGGVEGIKSAPHFTQLVWKASTEIGIAVARGRNKVYVICNYSPRGNKLRPQVIEANVPV